MCLSQFLFVFTERYQALVAWHSFFGSRLILSTALLTSPAEGANHCEKLNEIKSDKKPLLLVHCACDLFQVETVDALLAITFVSDQLK